MQILILGDIGASISNSQAFCDADKSLFSKEIRELCADADIVLLNLEKPLTDVLTPLGKCPPDYRALKKTIRGINLLSPTAVTLANNHIMDQSEQGLYSTIEILKSHNIEYVGAGENIEDARKPLIIEKAGFKIGIYACCEKEFSFATEDEPGANIFDPLYSLDDISELRDYCDHLIVLFHGGMQGYPYPTPRQQKVCRRMCDKGADLVVCQHSHIIGCEEEYNGARIIYGQGNFLLDESYDVSWHSGLIIEEKLTDGQKDIKYIPVETKNHRVRLCRSSGIVLEQFYNRSLDIQTPGYVQDMFELLSYDKLPEYLVKLSGTKLFAQKVLRRMGLTKMYSNFLYSKYSRYLMMDYLYCDSHREAIEVGLEVKNCKNTKRVK